MATPTTMVLGGSNLPDASEFKRKVGKSITQRRLANGSLHEVEVGSTKKVFTIVWNKITEAERDVIETKFASLQGGGTLSFTDVEGDVYTVANDEGQDEIEFDYFTSSGTLYYRATLRLRES